MLSILLFIEHSDNRTMYVAPSYHTIHCTAPAVNTNDNFRVESESNEVRGVADQVRSVTPPGGTQASIRT